MTYSNPDTAATADPATGSVEVSLRSLDFENKEVHYTVDGKPRKGKANLQNLTVGLPAVPSPAIELFYAATTAWLADRSIARDQQPDRWSRTINISFPVADPSRWPTHQVERLLRFVSNDYWTVTPYAATTEPTLNPSQAWLLPQEADAVDLFSGGLDSYGHAAAHSASTEPARLSVGHWDMPTLRGVQTALHRTLGRELGLHRDFHVATPSTQETSSRTRGFLFLSAAIAVATAMKVRTVNVPENGFVALNVPMTTARTGALSTRSTHPHTLTLVSDVLVGLDLDVRLNNPWIYATKGDITRAALSRLNSVAQTVSCSHPNSERWQGDSTYNNCGYCYPCLVRRSGIEAANHGNDPTNYRHDPRTDEAITNPKSKRHNDIYAVVARLATPPRPRDLYRTAPVPSDLDLDRIQDMRERSHQELSTMLNNNITTQVRRNLGL